MRAPIPYKYGQLVVPPADQWVGDTLERTGNLCPTEIEKLLNLTPQGGTVFEFGAHIGTFTVALAQRAGRVFAFEPQPVAFRYLQTNLLLNNCWNVVAYQYGGSDRPDVFELAATPDAPGTNSGGKVLVSVAAPLTQMVRSITLDMLMHERADLIKIDCEGFEPKILAGGLLYLAKHRPTLWVEFDREEHRVEIFSKLRDLNYDMVVHQDRLDPAQDTFSINLLATPKERLSGH